MTRAERDALETLARKATPGPWAWYNGCSWWRMGLAGDQGQHSAVLCPTKDHDGHPNLIVSVEDRDYIAACSPERVLALLARARNLEEALRAAITLEETMPERADALAGKGIIHWALKHKGDPAWAAIRAALADEAGK